MKEQHILLIAVLMIPIAIIILFLTITITKNNQQPTINTTTTNCTAQLEEQAKKYESENAQSETQLYNIIRECNQLHDECEARQPTEYSGDVYYNGSVIFKNVTYIIG